MQVPQGPLRRDGVAVMGPPMTQVRKAEEKAGPGECVMSPELWALVLDDAILLPPLDNLGPLDIPVLRENPVLSSLYREFLFLN